MVASHFHLPQQKKRSSKRSNGTDWKMNLILILLIVQTGFLAYWWWSGGRIPSPKTLDRTPSETAIQPEQTAPSGTESIQPIVADKQVQTARSYTEDPIRIQVLNGCGVRGMARRMANCLRSKGFDVRETGNADRYDYSESQVIGRVDDSMLARKVADDLGVNDISIDPNPDLVDIEVTVIIGLDHQSLRCP